MGDEATDIPRWAEELGHKTWMRIGDLLDAGWKTMDIVRELSIPENKVRSLQLHVQKHGPRRRLIQFAKFKDAVVNQIEEFGADLVSAISVTAALAVSNETKPAVQVRALEAMNNYTQLMSRLMADDAKAEAERKREDGTVDVKSDPVAALKAVLEKYGETVDGEE